MLQKLMNCGCSERWEDIGKLVLRLVLGVVFFMHGYQKVFQNGVDNVATKLFEGMLQWPMPTLFAYLVSYGELIVGALLIIGFLTHYASKIAMIIAIVALLAVHIKNGFFIDKGGFEYILLILAGTFAVMTLGGGKYSVDELMKSKSNVSEA